MSEQKDYNGWTNYETWNVALWIGNEEGSYRYWQQERALEAWEQAEADKTFTREERAVFLLEDWLKDEITEGAPDLGATMYADLLGAALSEVIWREIAEHYIDELDKPEEEAEEAEEAEED